MTSASEVMPIAPPSRAIEITWDVAVAVFDVRERTSSVPPVTLPSRCAFVAPSTSAVGTMIVTFTAPPPPPGMLAVALLSDVASTSIAPPAASIVEDESMRAFVDRAGADRRVRFRAAAAAEQPDRDDGRARRRVVVRGRVHFDRGRVDVRGELGGRAAVDRGAREADADRDEPAGADVGDGGRVVVRGRGDEDDAGRRPGAGAARRGRVAVDLGACAAAGAGERTDADDEGVRGRGVRSPAREP